MRFFLLPLSNKQTFLYCQKTAASPRPEAGLLTAWVDKGTARASKIWSGWEKAEGGWKKTLVGWGDSLLQRIPYQEWGFKSIPGPPSASFDYTRIQPITLSYPRSFLKQSQILSQLSIQATERQAFHRQQMRRSLVAMPFTLPFAIIPLMPNIPFFYLAYRAYSHWLAVGGSEHLLQLIKKNLITVQPEPVLDVVYLAGLFDIARRRVFDEATRAAATSDYPKLAEHLTRGELMEGRNGPVVGPLLYDEKPETRERPLLEEWNAKLLGPAVDCVELELEVDRALRQVIQSTGREASLKD